MAGIYGQRWASAYGDSPERFTAGGEPTGEPTEAGRAWQQGLVGVSREQLALGMRRALVSADPWPPTLPQFRALALGIPTLAQVLHTITKANTADEGLAAFCRLVWRFIDGYRFSRADTPTATRMVKDAYELAREYRMSLGELPPAPAGEIERQRPARPTRADTEVAEAHLQRIREVLRMGEDEPGDDANEENESA